MGFTFLFSITCGEYFFPWSSSWKAKQQILYFQECLLTTKQAGAIILSLGTYARTESRTIIGIGWEYGCETAVRVGGYIPDLCRERPPRTAKNTLKVILLWQLSSFLFIFPSLSPHQLFSPLPFSFAHSLIPTWSNNSLFCTHWRGCKRKNKNGATSVNTFRYCYWDDQARNVFLTIPLEVH